MSSTDINDLKAWVTRQQNDIRSGEEEAIIVDRLELWHAVESEGGERLKVVRSITGEDADEIASNLWAAAENDAQSRPNSTPQRYIVLAFDPNAEQNEPEDRIAFTLKGKSHALMFGDTDAPSEKGALGHSMRLSNNLHQMMLGMVEATTGRLARQLETETRRREKAEGLGLKLTEELQKALDRSQERELERAQELSRIRRGEELMQACVSLAPMLMTALLRKSLPEGAQNIARDKGIQKFLKTLSPEQITTFMETLQPEQRAVLMQIYASYREEEEKEQEALPEVLRDQRGNNGEEKAEEKVQH